MAGVPGGLGQHVHHDVEELHVRARPPRHVAGGVDGEGVDGRVRVRPHPPVPVDDLGPRLVLGRPHVGAERGLVIVPARHRLGERPAEDLAQVPGLRGGQVLDQAQQVGPGRGQRAADVVLRQPVQLPQHRLADPPQIAVQVLFREFVDHGPAVCQPPSGQPTSATAGRCGVDLTRRERNAGSVSAAPGARGSCRDLPLLSRVRRRGGRSGTAGTRPPGRRRTGRARPGAPGCRPAAGGRASGTPCRPGCRRWGSGRGRS